ncbi:MAG: DUF7347 domain-containing protein [Candidatus Hodarchaeales archaeon]
MSEQEESHQFFDLFSHRIRLSLIKSLNIGSRQFSELNQYVGNIESSKLNFHLKKLINGNIIEKKNKNYNLTEFGLRALHFIETYESGKLIEWDEDEDIDIKELEVSTIKKEIIEPDLEISRLSRPKGLPPAVRTIPLITGENIEKIGENFTLPLPEPIEDEMNSKTWIKQFIKPYKDLFTNAESNNWLQSRMLKLAYGTRGIRDYCILDSSLAVPPMKSFFDILSHTLESRGKAGFFAKTGMGKSRLILYLAHWWLKKNKTQVLLIDNPRDLIGSEWEKLISILSDNLSEGRGTPSWLLIIEDVHLTPHENFEFIRKIVSNSNPETWVTLIAFTEIPSKKVLDSKIDQTISLIKEDVIPLEISSKVNLDEVWLDWRLYFHEWVQWVALDILIQQIPWKDQNWKNFDLDKYSSPWSFVVSLGFLKSALENLQSSVTDNIFPLTLYSLLAMVYILKEEQGIEREQLFVLIESSFSQDLEDLYSNNWKEEIKILLDTWVDPHNRLIPPFTYNPIKDRLKQEPVINFYHQRWASYVCEHFLTSKASSIYQSLMSFFRKSVLPVYHLWQKVLEISPENERIDFLTWLRQNTRFEIYKTGEMILVYLNINKKQISSVKDFKLPDSLLNQLNETQLLNFSFIKSVITSY